MLSLVYSWLILIRLGFKIFIESSRICKKKKIVNFEDVFLYEMSQCMKVHLLHYYIIDYNLVIGSVCMKVMILILDSGVKCSYHLLCCLVQSV
jgi:hypothetical protein